MSEAMVADARSVRDAFRRMNEADLDAVCAIESRVQHVPWSRKGFLDSLEAGHDAWVLTDGGLVVGYGITMPVMEEAHLLTIAISPEQQRQGLGTALLQHLCATEQRRGARRMLLEVRAGNRAAQGLYEAHDFFTIAVRRNYYRTESGREDAIVMGCDL